MSEPTPGPDPDRPIVAHRLLLVLLRSPLGRLLGGVGELRFTGRRTDRLIALPVQCARAGPQLVIYVHHASAKQWWRNFLEDHSVQVRLGGVVYRGSGRVIDAWHPEQAGTAEIYRRRYRRIQMDAAEPFVVIDLALSDAAPEQIDRARPTRISRGDRAGASWSRRHS